jgi:phosphoglycolate phosphatase-like HAD superfamily hydrolase
VNAVAINLDVLGDTGPLWDDWLDDARRRYRVDGDDLDGELPNWRRLLERFAEDRAPVYFRRDADVTAALSRLHEGGAKLGVFTDAPEELARVALAHLGAERRIDALEAGTGSKDRLVERLGGAPVIETRNELLALRLG